MHRTRIAYRENEPLYLHPLAQAAAAILVGLALLVASAQLAAAKSIKIENRTDAALNELTIIHKQDGKPQKYVIARDVAAGAKVRNEIPRGVCLVDVAGVYSDKSTFAAEDLDVCRHHTLRLVK